MIPGSNQSPSDIETMIMVLNDAGDRFVEQFKPIEEVRVVALARLNAMCDAAKEWHFPDTYIQTECKEFLRGTRSMSDAAMIKGNTVDEKAVAAFIELKVEEPNKRAEKWAALDRKRAEMVAAINAETDPAKMLEIANDEQDYMSSTVDETECYECREFMYRLPTGRHIRTIFNRLGANCGADTLRKLVTTLGQETMTREIEYSGILGNTLKLARPDMIDVVGITDHKPTPIEKIAHEVHNLWVPVDRSGTLTSPLKITGPTIPEVGSFDKTFADVADARGAALWAENKKLAVFWSGGIDSTTALVALLKTVPDGRLGDLSVHYNLSSIEEYPEFYTEYIEGEWTVPHAKLMPEVVKPKDRYCPDNVFESSTVNEIAKTLKTSLVITGELGDQIFGSAGFANDPDKINSTIDDFLVAEELTGIRDEIDTLSAACPIPVNSVTTMMWWWNFALKWSEVRWRSLTAVRDSTDFDNIRHFFDTDDFQRWSIVNDDLKIKDTIQSYKYTAKDYIYDFAKHDDYRDQKLKIGSLHVRWGAPLAIDNDNNIIWAGDTSTDLELIKERYGNTLLRFAK
jgi:hypothetical protein